MPPNIRARHLIIHVVREERRLGASLENVVEPRIAKLQQIDFCDRVQFVSIKGIDISAEHVLCPALSAEVVVRADQQIVLGTWVVFVMLTPVVNGRSRSTGVVPRGD